MTTPPAAGDRILRPLWLTLAATFPFFAVEFLRVDNETIRIHLAIPMVVLALILGVVSVTCVAAAARGVETGWRVVPQTSWERALLASLAAFVAWHVVGWLRADAWVLPSRDLAKVAIGAVSLWGILSVFPRERAFLARFWTIVLFVSAVLVAVLIVQFAFVFAYPYLGNQIGGVPNSYSIQLAWYLTPVLLFASVYVPWAGRKSLAFLGLFVFAAGWLYISSRASWLAVLAGLLAVAPVVGYRKSLSYAGPFAAAVAAATVFLCTLVPAQVMFPRRALFLVSPRSVPELHSYDVRADLFRRTWNCFETSPVIGIGLGATNTCIQFETHNDYLKVLSDLGIAGLALLLSVLGVVAVKVLRGSSDESQAWLSLGGRASLVALLIMMGFHNLYPTTFFWILLGLFCVEAASRSEGVESGRTSP